MLKVRCFVGYFGSYQFFGRLGCPKVVSIKTFTISRDRFGRPDQYKFFCPSDCGRPGLFGLNSLVRGCPICGVSILWSRFVGRN